MRKRVVVLGVAIALSSGAPAQAGVGARRRRQLRPRRRRDVPPRTAPAADDPVTIAFEQHIGATEPLRTGSYDKTLTFTLSTTMP